MFKKIEIIENIFYVGINDRTKHLFENLWPLPKGVSYNSYIINDDKVVLVDTVDACYADIFFSKINSVIGDKPIDYLVVNHMEPDHSGSIALLKTRYPNIKIIGNARTAEMLNGFYGIIDNVQVIKDKEKLSIGKNTLEFHFTPMVHWPETMMTYIPESKTIFSADAFGTFGTLDGGVMDYELNVCNYWDEMIRYYSNIVGKYGNSVQAAFKKLDGVEIDTICSTHGPVWTQKENIEKVISIYDKLSKYEADNGLVIVYGSMYGNNEQVAEIIANGAARNGIQNIIMHNVSKSDASYIIRDVFKYKGLIIGSPTYNNKLYPGVESILSALSNRALRNRFFGSFGGYTWADATEKQLRSAAEGMNLEILPESVLMKQGLTPDVAEAAYKLGKAMADKLNSGLDAVANTHKECH